MKHKLTICLILLVTLAFTLTACSSSEETSGTGSTGDTGSTGGALSNAATTVSNTIAQMLDGNVMGEVGKTYKTEWFEFTIKSIDKVDSYAGYEAEDGYELYDVLVHEKCTFDEAIPMGTYDFYMDESSWDEYIFPIDPLDDTMMPVEFYLEKNDEAEYHMVFEIPVTTSGLTLHYTEYAEDESVGATFTININ